jgi:hypothetical protein
MVAHLNPRRLRRAVASDRPTRHARNPCAHIYLVENRAQNRIRKIKKFFSAAMTGALEGGHFDRF